HRGDGDERAAPRRPHTRRSDRDRTRRPGRHARLHGCGTVIDRIRRALARQQRTPGRDPKAILKRRTTVVAVFLLLWAAGIEARLVKLQVLDHADLVARADSQQQRTIKAPSRRGDIVDRRGHVLATSVDADTIYAVPTELGDKAAAVAKLCGALG